jgi:hypothetical protein
MKSLSIIFPFFLLTASVAQGQWWGGADLGLETHTGIRADHRGGMGLSASAGWERGRVRAEAGGMWAGADHAFEGRSIVRVPWRRFTLSLDGRAGLEGTGQGRWGRVAGQITLSYQRHGWGLWAGYALSGVSGAHSLVARPEDEGTFAPADTFPLPAPQPDPVPPSPSLAVPIYQGGVTAGGWRQAGPILLTLALASDLVRTDEVVAGTVDTLASQRIGTIRRAAQAEVGGAWGQGPVNLRLTVGRRLAHGSDTWGSLEGTVALFRGLAVVGRMGRQPADLRTGRPAQSFAFAGVRLSTNPFRASSVPVPVRPALLRVALDTLGAGDVRLWAVAPHATSVELMSDLTDWQARSLIQVDAGRWTVVLAREPGPHRVLMRVDGGAWSVPPELPEIEDEFHDRVGLLVVP